MLRRIAAYIWAIRTRLLLVNAIIVAVPVAGVGFARLYEREMLRALEADMIHQAEAVRELVRPSGEGDDALSGHSERLSRIARRTSARIRLVDKRGVVVSDSAGGTMPGRRMSELREIRRALGGRYGAATRAGEGRSYLYSSLPVYADTGAGAPIVGAVVVQKSTVSVHRSMHRLRESLWKLLWWSLALTAVVTLLLAATISRPLSRLTRRAERIAAGDRRVGKRSMRRDEIGKLDRAVHDMASQLDARATDIADLAADIAHEFKSPLTSLRGAAELLAGNAGTDAAARDKFTANITRDVDRLDRLVTQLSVLTRVDADGEPWQVIDIAALVREVVASHSDGADIELCGDTGAIEATVRTAHIESAVTNLVDNAVAHADGPVRVTLKHSGGFATVDVHNEGSPIEAADLPLVWDRFYSTRRGGTGLGLPIVATAARAHGGKVWAQSDRERGTTFGFSIRTGEVV